MIVLLKQLFGLLTPQQRKQLFTLQILIIIMAGAEAAGIASVGFFVGMLGDITILERDNVLSQIYLWSGILDPHSFVFWVGVGLMIFLMSSAAISVYTIWQVALFGSRLGAEIGSRLYRHYMYQNWLFHASENSAQLTKQISVEAMRVTSYVINPLMQVNARLMVVSFILITIFVIDPIVAATGLAIFALAYVLLYKIVRNRLMKNGRIVSEVSTLRLKLLAEGFGGIKDLLLLGRQKDFVERFRSSSDAFANAQGVNSALAQFPRYIMELFAYGSIILLVLFLIKAYEGDLGAVLPMLAVYALAGFKLLPTVQQIYSNIAKIKGNIAAFESIREDLKSSQRDATKQLYDPLCNENNVSNTVGMMTKVDRISPKLNIELKNVSFTYPGKEISALDNLSMNVPVNKVIGIVGSSGSGKSTTIDMLLGLISPQKGQMLVDGQVVDSEELRAWQNALGFVPQSIFLSDASILENIAFGLPKKKIDVARIEKVLKLSRLDDLVGQLPDGLETVVGERGVQLSGGQRQRIGIARSLYQDAEVLILDEATSALDGITEKLIMDAIHDFSGSKTIIMIAHRLKTVKKCDVIYLMEQGKIKDQGTFEELNARNEIFKSMARHA